MRRQAVSRGIESALERVVELPFVRRVPVNLPLLQAALRRAMEDEVKPVVPSRYTLTVPAEHTALVGEHREEWERELTQYFLDVLRSNRWSAIGEPRVTIAYDPALTGSRVQVGVEEPGLISGGTPRRGRRPKRIVAVMALATMLILLAILIAVVLRPALESGRGSMGPSGTAIGEASPARIGLEDRTASWWDNI